jgi:Skp family chaperone for outer membrane proteins
MRARGGLRQILASAGFVLAVLAAALPTIAQEAIVSAPILTLDEDRLFAESLFGKAVLARQEVEAQSLTSENRQIEAGLEQEEKTLTARRATLSKEEFLPLSDAFNAKVEGIRGAQEAKARALSRQFEDEKQRFFSEVRPVLAQIMTERGAVVIIDKRAVFVGFDNVDVTAAAIAALDASLGDGSAAAPATP